MAEWKVGDKAEILEDCFDLIDNYKKGAIRTVNFVDQDGDPTFIGDNSRHGWSKHSYWFRKVEHNEVSPADPVIHPKDHTNHSSGIKCIQITENMGFLLGNAMKYLWEADLNGNSI